jgi:hydroxyacylglutathione hydrolase
MIKLEKLTFNPFQENTYLLYDETGECLIIDPGCMDLQEQQRLASTIMAKQLKPVMLIHTHLHLDHVFGSKFVANNWELPVLAHKADEFFIPITKEYALKFGIQVNENPPALTGYLSEGDEVGFGKSSVKVIHVPGHSPGGVCFYAAEEKILVAGDILFAGSVGRTDLAMGDYDALIDNIKAKLLILPDDTVVYPGHGPSTTIGQEKLSNGFLQ